MQLTPEERKQRRREAQKRWRDANMKKWRKTHAEQIRQKKRRWYQKNKERISTQNRLKQRSKSVAKRRHAEYAVIAGRSRADACDVCGRVCRTVFDHCHQRGHFRGWLCNPCNQALGMVNDDPNILRKLIAYLERNAINHSPQLTFPGI